MIIKRVNKIILKTVLKLNHLAQVGILAESKSILAHVLHRYIFKSMCLLITWRQVYVLEKRVFYTD